MTNPEEDTPEPRTQAEEEPFLFTDPPRGDAPEPDTVNIVVEFVPPEDDEEPFLFTDPPRGVRFRLLEEEE